MKNWYVDESLVVLGLGAIALVQVLRWNQSITLQRDTAPLRADAATFGAAQDAANCRVTDGERTFELTEACLTQEANAPARN